jgi:hypothetical protein
MTNSRAPCPASWFDPVLSGSAWMLGLSLEALNNTNPYYRRFRLWLCISPGWAARTCLVLQLSGDMSVAERVAEVLKLPGRT